MLSFVNVIRLLNKSRMNNDVIKNRVPNVINFPIKENNLFFEKIHTNGLQTIIIKINIAIVNNKIISNFYHI